MKKEYYYLYVYSVDMYGTHELIKGKLFFDKDIAIDNAKNIVLFLVTMHNLFPEQLFFIIFDGRKNKMKKIIAKTYEGKEYLYSKFDTYQANQKKIDIICKAMNKAAYRLKPGEKYHIYNISDIEYKHTFYKLVNRKGKLFVSEIWSINPGI